MQYYCAPLEGVTGHIFRCAHHRYFSGVDKYFMPFLSPNMHHCFSKKELQDVLPANNAGIPAVPQLLTKSAADFLWAAGALAEMGYPEVNLNLGCPSGTVVAKGKGAGLLREPAQLDRFLDEIFRAAPVAISVKTRLGLTRPEEFFPLLEIFSRYPVAELIIHPRVQQDFYKNRPRMEVFEAAARQSRNPVCYNGDLVMPDDCLHFSASFPNVSAVMLGRGLVANPALARQARGGAAADKQTLRAYHDEIYHGYCDAFGSARNAILRMKELWFYMLHLFAESERAAKKLRKLTDPRDYVAWVDAVYQNLALNHTIVPFS